MTMLQQTRAQDPWRTPLAVVGHVEGPNRHAIDGDIVGDKADTLRGKLSSAGQRPHLPLLEGLSFGVGEGGGRIKR